MASLSYPCLCGPYSWLSSPYLLCLPPHPRWCPTLSLHVCHPCPPKYLASSLSTMPPSSSLVAPHPLPPRLSLLPSPLAILSILVVGLLLCHCSSVSLSLQNPTLYSTIFLLSKPRPSARPYSTSLAPFPFPAPSISVLPYLPNPSSPHPPSPLLCCTISPHRPFPFNCDHSVVLIGSVPPQPHPPCRPISSSSPSASDRHYRLHARQHLSPTSLLTHNPTPLPSLHLPPARLLVAPTGPPSSPTTNLSL